MANYDQATKDFIEGMTKEIPSARSRGQVLRGVNQRGTKEVGKPVPPLIQAKVTAGLVSSIADPKKLPAYLARRMTSNVLEKNAADISDELNPKPLQVYNKMMQTFGRSWLDWDADTLRFEMPIKLPAISNEDGYQTVQALQTIAKTNFPFELWHVFENVGHAINNNVVMVDYVTPLEPHEIALTVDVMNSIRGNGEDDLVLSDEVCAYIAASAMNAGMVILPEKYFDTRSQEALDMLNMDLGSKEEVKAALESDSDDHSEMVMIQIGKLREVIDYVLRNNAE